jgi:glycosyltransferase involved in cell wall biosynthesis
VLFPGAIYDQATLDALRFYAALYIHGHTVGGTNPALVEALGAGCAILAQDNRFNRWVAGEAARYFHDQADCAGLLDELLDDEAGLNQLRTAARQRHAAEFTWDRVLAAYESLLWEYVAV